MDFSSVMFTAAPATTTTGRTTPNTVADLCLSPDSTDSFYHSSDSSSISDKIHYTDASAAANNSVSRQTNLMHNSATGDASHGLSMKEWMNAEGIVDIQQVLFTDKTLSPRSGSVYSTEDNNSYQMDSEEEDGRTPEERMEVSEVMSMPPKTLTAQQKKIRRRELNRLAAQRSRSKKRAASTTLAQEASALSKKNSELKSTLDSLLKEKEIYLKAVKHHFQHHKVRSHQPPPCSFPAPSYRPEPSTYRVEGGSGRVV